MSFIINFSVKAQETLCRNHSLYEYYVEASEVTAQALEQGWPEAIGFTRLHTLARRGYRPILGMHAREDELKFVQLEHPRRSGKNVPPPVTLWSDGIITTTKVLWPAKYVPTADGPPDWQRFISPDEGDRFDSFAASIERPNLIDLYVAPAMREAKTFGVKLVFGTSLCVVIASALKLVVYVV